VIEVIRKVLSNVLTAIYQPLGFAVLTAVLFMFLYMFAKEHGWKNVFIGWGNEFKSNTKFRRVFFLSFYTAMILFRTLLTRKMWENPLSNVIGTWGIYDENGELTTEIIENTILFIPFTALSLWALRKRLLKNVTFFTAVLQSAKISFLFSVGIEAAQLLFRLGTFQLSDLCFNTLGGIIGGVLYYASYRFSKRDRI
jgi:glycopeptide antibiotics resistance protein